MQIIFPTQIQALKYLCRLMKKILEKDFFQFQELGFIQLYQCKL